MNKIYGNVIKKGNIIQMKHFAFKHDNYSQPFTYNLAEICVYASTVVATLIQDNIHKKKPHSSVISEGKYKIVDQSVYKYSKTTTYLIPLLNFSKFMSSFLFFWPQSRLISQVSTNLNVPCDISVHSTCFPILSSSSKNFHNNTFLAPEKYHISIFKITKYLSFP